MDELTRLVETEAIKRLKYKYMRCIDQKLWDELSILNSVTIHSMIR